MKHVFTVEQAAETSLATYFRVSSGPKGGQPVTVRVGFQGVFACLTCLKIDCIHADAAKDFYAAQRAKAVA